MPIDPIERAMLRERAVDRWRNSKALRREAGFLAGGGSVNTTTLEHLADRAIREWRSPHRDLRRLDGGTALVASANMGELIRFKELVATSVPYVLGASDAGTALGLAIVTQPDLAIVDNRLELASGIDLALNLPFYAPRTRALVLTDDPERAHDVLVVGFETARRHANDSMVLDWIERTF